ncbi:unnamed protein product [Cylicocyclus nassatus]|uniref:Uncharacterized protein n=1 Tax=Cylicocyclus nassatus TaxID=53992 RepID=A0AA36H810_CYLNA|nr:unnamed protein product [Cylicocyclus nassatus]
MEAVWIRILDVFKCINTIDGEYLVIDDDKICKTLQEAHPKRPRGASNKQQHLEETDMFPAKRSQVKYSRIGTMRQTVVNEEAKADSEVDFIVRAVRAALQEKKYKTKGNMNPLVDEIFSLD